MRLIQKLFDNFLTNLETCWSIRVLCEPLRELVDKVGLETSVGRGRIEVVGEGLVVEVVLVLGETTLVVLEGIVVSETLIVIVWIGVVVKSLVVRILSSKIIITFVAEALVEA